MPRGRSYFRAATSRARFRTPGGGTFQTTVQAWIPEDARAGQQFDVRVGVYHPPKGQRMAPAGTDDGTRRIRLGTVRFEPGGGKLHAVWTAMPPMADPLLARQNPMGKPVDFGPLVTADGCRVTHGAAGVEVAPLPQSAGQTFSAKIRWACVPWHLTEPKFVEQIDESGKVVAHGPVTAAKASMLSSSARPRCSRAG